MPIRLSRRSGMALIGVVSASSLALSACGSSGSSSTSSGPVTITVAVTANPLMTTIEQLTPAGFEKSHPNIKVKFVTYDENTERANVEKDVAAGGGQYDVVMIGPNDIASWAKNKWIDPLTSYANSDASYDVGDLLPAIKDALSSNGTLYAVPFYGESSFMMYNKQMFAAAHVTMPAHPTWAQIAALAAKLNDPSAGVAGICLRGLTGWGDNLASLDTVVNTFGGQWFDTHWNAHLTSPAFEQATNFYVNLVRDYGEVGASSAGFSECGTAYSQGQAAMWYDATSMTGTTEDPTSSKVVGLNGYAPAPVVNTKAAGWLYTWSLAIPKTTVNKDAAWQFMSWMTDKQYMSLVGNSMGWSQVPPGSRLSTYQIPQYKAAAKAYAQPTLDAINSATQANTMTQPVPYYGLQFVGIPEFQDLGTRVSDQISAAVAGQETVPQALQQSQQYAQTVGDTYRSKP